MNNIDTVDTVNIIKGLMRGTAMPNNDLKNGNHKNNGQKTEGNLTLLLRNFQKRLEQKLPIKIKTISVEMFASTFIVLLIAFFISNGQKDLNGAQMTGKAIIFLLCYVFLFVYFCGSSTTGKELNNSEVALLSILTAVYFIFGAFLNSYHLYGGYLPTSIILPSALFIMLIEVMLNPAVARVMSLMLPLGVWLMGDYDFYSYLFAIISGVSATFILEGAKHRIDLVKAGGIVAIVNVVTIVADLMIRGNVRTVVYAWAISLAALNGIISAMLVLGITPILENMLRSATTFKLIELLDLNEPLMLQLAAKTPGTFNHSMVVSTLAESACQEIGANPLLARVGAYYHDIGKIDQPQYFTENQHGENKHDDINPRLSATVIRSHVKVGVEKGRAAGLPNEVIDIIATHHGNSLIAYFYYEAIKKEGENNVKREDFTYPSEPPRTKEAAVILLADTIEAAVRSEISKPEDSKVGNPPSSLRLEKFINELISAKVEDGQLSRAELTFRELEAIKKVFVRVLLSYYHSRIAYPKFPEDKNE